MAFRVLQKRRSASLGVLCVLGVEMAITQRTRKDAEHAEKTKYAFRVF
jgi:hypothetical protein